MSAVTQLVAAIVLSLASTSLWAQDTVVYHVNDAKNHALAALRNIRNHLDTDPSAKITVVANGFGIDFLMEDAKDRNSVAGIRLHQALGR